MQPLSHNIEDYPQGIILPIDKPYRWTSADVIRKVKYMAIRHFGKKNLKVGHAGTLDPLATGILLVCIGAATKKAEELQRSAKQYVAGVTFGATTPSYDLEKEIDREFPIDSVSAETVRNILPQFIGEQDQVAPLFSAKSVDGVRAYETARKLFKAGLPLDDTGILQANRITIYNLNLDEYQTPGTCFQTEGGTSSSETVTTLGLVRGRGPSPDGRGRAQRDVSEGVVPPAAQVPGESSSNDRNNRIHVADISGYSLPTAMIRVDCSKGTYIRSLARDLGEALGSGAFLSSLRRTKNGGFTIEDAITMDQLQDLFRP